MQFNRQCDNINEWIEDIENQLSSSDHGKDVTSANSLLKKHKVNIFILLNILYYVIYVFNNCYLILSLFYICDIN